MVLLVNNKKKRNNINTRYIFLVVIMITIFTAIIYSLYKLQITKGDSYTAAATIKAHDSIPVSAPRGKITDKNGVQLAADIPSYNVTYVNTSYSEKQFYTTMSKVFKLIDDNSETQVDDFPLKVDPYRFEFNVASQSNIDALKYRFLDDRGLTDAAAKKMFSKAKKDLTDDQKAKVKASVMKYTPQYVFNQLIDYYRIKDGIKTIRKNYTIQDERRYLIVKDSIKMHSFSENKTVDIADKIKPNTARIFWQELSNLPGVNVEMKPLRNYPLGQLAAPALGYISKINSDKQEEYKEKGYDTSSDYIGATGLEAAFESRLRGEKGEQIVQVDSKGKITNTLATKEASPGYDLQTTLDANVQYATDQAFNNETAKLRATGTSGGDLTVNNATRGGAIAIDVNTGGILALTSQPTFNPNDFVNPNGLTKEQSQEYFNPDYEKMAKDKGMPQDLIDFMFPIDTSIKGNTTIRKDLYDYFPKNLYNYPLMGMTPCGSTFKPLTAIAGLESKAIARDYTYDDQNTYDYGDGKAHTFEGANGRIGIEKALAVSSNPFFMSVAETLKNAYGNDSLAKYAWQFGLGADPNVTNSGTGVEIPENFGQVYNTVSQKKLFARQYLIEIEQDLSTGNGSNKTTFPQIDLYDRDGDNKIDGGSVKLSDIKAKIKNDIKNSIMSGIFSTNNYMNEFEQLIAIDPKYKGKTISSNDIKLIVSDVYYDAISDGNSQLKGKASILNAAIGQGMDNFTLLQLAGYVATLANGGTRYSLHLEDKITDPSGKVVEEKKPEVLNKVNIDPQDLAIVKQGMEDVNQQGEEGTAAKAFAYFNQFIPTAGKTGTAEFKDKDTQNKIGRSDYGLYIGFAPVDKPQIAVAIIVYDGGYGSDVANVARQIYEAYFKDQLQKQNYQFDIDVNAKPEN